MKKLFLFSLILFTGCQQNDSAPAKDESADIMRTDKDFSALSQQKGMRVAFLQYIDTTGILLRPGHDPLKGVRAEQFIEQIDDSSSYVIWYPDTAIISKNNDLGYTYGKFYIKECDTCMNEDGTYVTIWKKQPDGKWKFVLDSGNPGLSKK